MLALIIAVISSSSLTTFIHWLLNRGKMKVDIEKERGQIQSQSILNVETITDICNKTFKELKEAREEISTLSSQVKELTEANTKLSKEVKDLTESNGKLDCEVQKLRRELKKHGHVDGNQG